jgi:hypothetical protein
MDGEVWPTALPLPPQQSDNQQQQQQISKFQQQLSGEWNKNVLEKTQWQDSDMWTPFSDDDDNAIDSDDQSSTLTSMSSSYPEELAAADAIDSSVDSSSMITAAAVVAPVTAMAIPSNVSEILVEIDRDYYALRSKLVALIEQSSSSQDQQKQQRQQKDNVSTSAGSSAEIQV